MTNAQQDTVAEQERVEECLALGFSPAQATILAATQEGGEQADIELVRRLLEAGCEHELAMRIVL